MTESNGKQRKEQNKRWTMENKEKDELYMRRCIQLAKNGLLNTRPNPMVGAVIVCDDRIIGEGYHVRCGEGHAEVNAFASVKASDEHLLPHSTIYVSLEPCAHHGKTPPCADLIVSKGVNRVVVGCVDPFAEVQGRGIKKIRDAGIDVTVGVLEEECRELNSRFFTFNTRHRPYVILKWCMTADGFLDDNFRQMAISSPFTMMLSHKLRAENDAILIGRITDERDRSRLDVRHWKGHNPMRIVINRDSPCFPELDFKSPVVPQILNSLYRRGVQSLIVEGGAATHNSFIESGLWDEIRVEMSPVTSGGGTKAPQIPTEAVTVRRREYDGNIILNMRKSC